MIDASVDPDFAALEREPSRRPASRRDAAPARPRATGTLAALPSAPPSLALSRGTLDAGEVSASVAVPPPPSPRETATPLDHLRLARFGFVAALFLLAAFLWSRQWRRR